MTKNEQEPGAFTVLRLKNLCRANGLTVQIVPVWQGRDKSGLLQVLDQLGVTVEQQAFLRNSHAWTDADAQLGTVHTGSPKHQAVLDITERLIARLYSKEHLTPEQEEELALTNYR